MPQPDRLEADVFILCSLVLFIPCDMNHLNVGITYFDLKFHDPAISFSVQLPLILIFEDSASWATSHIQINVLSVTSGLWGARSGAQVMYTSSWTPCC